MEFNDLKSSEYFKPYELWSKDDQRVKLDPRFDEALFFYRETLGIPLVPNSCCRSIAHNRAIGGSSRSYHVYEDIGDGREGALAIDLRVRNDKERVTMVETALAQNWSVGIYKTFIHIDKRVVLGKPQVCFWGKY
jgi:hypothetical protein